MVIVNLSAWNKRFIDPAPVVRLSSHQEKKNWIG